MKNVDEALHIYTDSLNNTDDVEIESFKDQLSEEDYIAFAQLAQNIAKIANTKNYERNVALFNKINDHKKQFYNAEIKTAANFRTENGEASEKAKETIDKLFDEEFEDE